MNKTKAYTKKINDQEIKLICEKLKEYIVENKNQYALHVFNFSNTRITIFKNKNLLIHGDGIEKILSILGISTEFKLNVNTKYEIGSDETGVGDLIGGLVVCCVKIDNEKLKKIEHLNINDSKKLSDSYILEIYDELVKNVDHKILSISAKKYNALNSKYKNSHILKALLHNESHKYFTNNESTRIIDMFAVSAKKYYEYVSATNQEIIKIDIFEHKAESKYPSVAIASIIARGYFLKQIKKIEQKIKLKIPLGAWNPKIQDFCEVFIKKYGKEALNEIIKHDFKINFLEK